VDDEHGGDDGCSTWPRSPPHEAHMLCGTHIAKIASAATTVNTTVQVACSLTVLRPVNSVMSAEALMSAVLMRKPTGDGFDPRSAEDAAVVDDVERTPIQATLYERLVGTWFSCGSMLSLWKSFFCSPCPLHEDEAIFMKTGSPSQSWW